MLRRQASRIAGASDVLQTLHQAQNLLAELRTALQKIPLGKALLDARGQVQPQRLHLGLRALSRQRGLLALQGPRAKPGQLLGECIAGAAHIAWPQRGVLRAHFADILQLDFEARVRQCIGLLYALLRGQGLQTHAGELGIIGLCNGQQRLHIGPGNGSGILGHGHQGTHRPCQHPQAFHCAGSIASISICSPCIFAVKRTRSPGLKPLRREAFFSL